MPSKKSLNDGSKIGVAFGPVTLGKAFKKGNRGPQKCGKATKGNRP